MANAREKGSKISRLETAAGKLPGVFMKYNLKYRKGEMKDYPVLYTAIIEEVDLLVGEEDEECSTDSDGGHQIRKEGHAVYIACPAASAVLRDRVSDQGTDGTCDQRTADSN